MSIVDCRLEVMALLWPGDVQDLLLITSGSSTPDHSVVGVSWRLVSYMGLWLWRDPFVSSGDRLGPYVASSM